MELHNDQPAGDKVNVELLETGPGVDFDKVTEWIERLFGRKLTPEEIARGRKICAGKIKGADER